MIGLPCFQTVLLLAQSTELSPPEWRIRWTWDWPLWLTCLLALGAVVWVVSLYKQEISPVGRTARMLLALLRIAALALVAMMIAQPVVEWFRLGRPRVVVLVDRSASMAVEDELAGLGNGSAASSRIDAWKAILAGGEQPLVDKWRATYQLDVVTFDEQFQLLPENVRALSEQLQLCEAAIEKDVGTRLGDAVDFALRQLPGPPPAAIVVFTDGVTTRGQPLSMAARRARGLRVPLYTIALGSEHERPDVALNNMIVEQVVFPGDRLQVEATLHSTGFAGRSINVTLRNAAEDAVLAQATITLPDAGTSESVLLAFQPKKPGELPLKLSVEPLAGEADLENNVQTQSIEVRDEKIRVLLVQASPSYEFRALKSLLERDPAVELSVLLQEADVDYSEVDETAISEFPYPAEELFEYDVVMLGDVDSTLLPQNFWPLLERFVVEQGGGVVCIAGPRFMPYALSDNLSLQVLLPIELDVANPLRAQVETTQSYPIEPTVLGWRSPSMQLGRTMAESQAVWESLPPVTWLLEVEQTKPGAQILAASPKISGESLPVILRHYVGAGEVLFHATDESWRWRWRSDDRYFARYWGQVVRQLGRGRLVANRQGVQLTVDRSQYKPGEAVKLQVRYRNPAESPAEDQHVVVQLQSTYGTPQKISLRRRFGHRGIFEASVDDLAPADYEVALLQAGEESSRVATQFAIQPPPRELARIAVDRRSLYEAAEISGGKAYTSDTVARLNDDLPQSRQTVVEQLSGRPLWNSHFVVALLVSMLAAEWLLRRRWGML